MTVRVGVRTSTKHGKRYNKIVEAGPSPHYVLQVGRLKFKTMLGLRHKSTLFILHNRRRSVLASHWTKAHVPHGIQTESLRLKAKTLRSIPLL